jgi:hypothetical protein
MDGSALAALLNCIALDARVWICTSSGSLPWPTFGSSSAPLRRSPRSLINQPSVTHTRESCSSLSGAESSVVQMGNLFGRPRSHQPGRRPPPALRGRSGRIALALRKVLARRIRTSVAGGADTAQLLPGRSASTVDRSIALAQLDTIPAQATACDRMDKQQDLLRPCDPLDVMVNQRVCRVHFTHEGASPSQPSGLGACANLLACAFLRVMQRDCVGIPAFWYPSMLAHVDHDLHMILRG